MAMLWQVPGYSVDEAVSFLRSLGRPSDAGQAFGRLLGSNDASAEHAALAAQFWEKSIHEGTAETLGGIGWYAEVSALDDVTWARLTRQTLAITRGRIEWPRRVADRTARPQPTPDTLEILNLMLRGLPESWDQRSVLDTATSQSRKLIIPKLTPRNTSAFVSHLSNAPSPSPARRKAIPRNSPQTRAKAPTRATELSEADDGICHTVSETSQNLRWSEQVSRRLLRRGTGVASHPPTPSHKRAVSGRG